MYYYVRKFIDQRSYHVTISISTTLIIAGVSNGTGADLFLSACLSACFRFVALSVYN